MRLDRCLTVFALLVGLALLPACGAGGPKVDQEVEDAWALLTETKEKLDGLRAEAAEVKAQLKASSAAEAEAEGEGEEGGEENAPEGQTMPSRENLEAKEAELEASIGKLADDLGGQLAAFLNDPRNQIFEGEPLTERQQAGVRMKSSEDMELASEYVDKGGDYRRAIDILRVASQLDPDNAGLQAALAETEANRYMSEERFALAKEGMTRDEVREVLGQVNLRNIRQYPDRNVVAWFYATADGGAAAAVWFSENKKSGQLEAYQLKLEAVAGSGG